MSKYKRLTDKVRRDRTNLNSSGYDNVKPEKPEGAKVGWSTDYSVEKTLVGRHATVQMTAVVEVMSSGVPMTFREIWERAQAIHRVGDMMGAQVKDVRACEADVRLVASQSLCARHDLAAGHRLTQENLTVKRPGSGIPAAHLQDTLGRRLIAPVKANDLIGPDDLA